MMEWNRKDILYIIKLIRERPAIWDVESPDYKNKQKKFEAIKDVGSIMGVSAREVNAKWMILRNQFSREKRKISYSDGRNDGMYTTKWYAYDEMEKLMAGSSRRSSNYQSFSEEDESSSTSTPTADRSIIPIQWGNNESNTISPTQNETTRTKRDSSKNSQNRDEETNKQKDDLSSFGIYVAAHLRKYPARLQCKAKYEINKLLYALDLESLEHCPIDQITQKPLKEGSNDTSNNNVNSDSDDKVPKEIEQQVIKAEIIPKEEPNTES